MANKVYKDAKSALDGLLRDGMMLMCGGFGLVGIPEKLIEAVRASGVKGLKPMPGLPSFFSRNHSAGRRFSATRRRRAFE